MATNPYVNKVELADGTVLMDSTGTTVTPDKLMNGITALDRSGAVITGTLTTDSIFIAEHGTTTEAELEQAIADNKLILCHAVYNTADVYLPLIANAEYEYNGSIYHNLMFGTGFAQGAFLYCSIDTSGIDGLSDGWSDVGLVDYIPGSIIIDYGAADAASVVSQAVQNNNTVFVKVTTYGDYNTYAYAPLVDVDAGGTGYTFSRIADGTVYEYIVNPSNVWSINTYPVPSPATVAPSMDGTAAVGVSTNYARQDHVHPTDTSRQATITASGILKGNGSGTVSAAVAGTDYMTPANVSASYVNKSSSAGQGDATSSITNAAPTGTNAGIILTNQSNTLNINNKLSLVSTGTNITSTSSSGTNTLALTPTTTTIHNVVTPTANGDAANKKYVDDAVSGISVPVTSVNSKTGAVVLAASDVGALPDSTVIPSATSDLTNDSGFITASDISEATDNISGTIKTNSADGIQLNSDGQLEVTGRLGQMPTTTGLYSPVTISPNAVGNGSLLVTEASNTSLGNKSLSVTTGMNVTLATSAAAGSTQYSVANTYVNRIICTIALGGVACLNEANSLNTVSITSITLDGATIAPSSTNTSSSNIIITTASSINPNAATSTIRVYPLQNGFSNLLFGVAKTNDRGYSVVGGQNVGNLSNASAVFGNSNYNTGNSSMLAGRQHINTQQNAMLAGIGHDTTSANTNITAVGEWSKLDVADAGNILFAVGNGSSATNRSNAFVVSENYTYVDNELRIDQLKNDQGLLKVGQYGTVSTATAGTDYVVPSTTVNGKALSSNITLTPSDVSAVAVAGDTMTGALKVTAPMIAGSTADGSITIEHGTAGSDAMLVARRTDTGTSMGVGVGTGGVNHGIYSHTLGKWMIYGTATDVMVNGKAQNVTGTVEVANGGTGATTLTSGAALIGNGANAVSTRAITNNTSATAAASSSTNLITQNTLYYATASINNARQTSSVGVYAPTSAGTANQILVSSGGTSAPTWKATAAGAAYATSANGALTFGTLPVAQGGTGASTFTSGAALIGSGTGAITTRTITNNTAATSAITGSTNLVTMNTLRYALNRTTGPGTADTNYTTAMMRAIQMSTVDLTAGSSSLLSGRIYLVYEA